jgi:hypothetical protein
MTDRLAPLVQKTLDEFSSRVSAGEALPAADAKCLLGLFETAMDELRRCDAAIASGVETLARFRAASVPTLDEERVLLSLSDAWNGYARLDVYHSDEPNEFRDAIHRCQDLIAVRIVRRLDPGTWRATT